jgi:5-methylcytosine-specific restriction endonuclease McrA
LHYDCLQLNADFTPLSIVPLSTENWQDAIKKIYEGTAYAIENYGEAAHSPSVTIPLPAVLVLRDYKKTSRMVKYSRANVFLRDEYVCQYCGKDMQNDIGICTLDHVFPKKLGGRSVWENAITACPDCNLEKGHELSMKPRTQPVKPSLGELISKRRRMPLVIPHASWQDYLQWDPALVILRKK